LAIPLPNEAGTLKSLCQEIKAVLDVVGISYEIIFVNDDSTDETPNLLRQIKRTDHRVRVIEHKQNYEECCFGWFFFAFANSFAFLVSRGPFFIPKTIFKHSQSVLIENRIVSQQKYRAGTL